MSLVSPEISLAIAVITVTIAIVNFLYSRFKIEKDFATDMATLKEQVKDGTELKEQITAMDEKLSALCERVKGLEVKSDVIWNAVQSAVTNMLHHPTEPRRDELIEKFNAQTINLKELEELKTLLSCKIVDPVEKKSPKTPTQRAVREAEERIASILLIALIDAKTYDMAVSLKKISPPDCSK